jgi:ribosomal protein L19
MSDLIKFVEAENATRRAEHPEFAAGDTVNVHVKIREGNKERIQVFQGLVIQRKNSGAGESFTVRKISNGKVEARPVMYVALTYDHRLIDGREAVTFLKKIKQVI